MTPQELYKLPLDKRLEAVNKIKEETGAVPPQLSGIYESLKRDMISHLRSDDFIKIRNEWCNLYPDFRMITEIMDDFLTNQMLVEFCKGIPPKSILGDALSIYKKCISFKEKFSTKIQNNLSFTPDTPVMFYARARYCIDKEKVHLFLNQYQTWYRELYPYWNKVHYETRDFFYNEGYDRLGWEFYIQRPDFLKRKAEEIKKLHSKVVKILCAGNELISKLDREITLEYETNGLEMSLYEREEEIAEMNDECNFSDEAYCYVYTLECNLFVFYVGIASDPRERFEQHIKGAFSDESHLFKSKFIQKYKDEVIHKIVFEGSRRECKNFEKSYIAIHRPLGNMTEGGEG